MNICLYGASSNDIDPAFLSAGEGLGREMAARGHTLVFGGGADGMMGSAARGVSAGGGTVVGIAPSFFNVNDILYKKCTELILTETMRERKQLMEEKSDAFLMTPGGIGTMEEFFEILTLKQLGRHHKPIAVLNLGHYYDDMEKMLQKAVDGGFMRPECMKIFSFCDTPAAALDALEYEAAHPADVRHLKNL